MISNGSESQEPFSSLAMLELFVMLPLGVRQLLCTLMIFLFIARAGTLLKRRERGLWQVIFEELLVRLQSLREVAGERRNFVLIFGRCTISPQKIVFNEEREVGFALFVVVIVTLANWAKEAF